MRILLETPSMDSRRAEAQQAYHSQFKRLLHMPLMVIILQLRQVLILARPLTW